MDINDIERYRDELRRELPSKLLRAELCIDDLPDLRYILYVRNPLSEKEEEFDPRFGVVDQVLSMMRDY